MNARSLLILIIAAGIIFNSCSNAENSNEAENVSISFSGAFALYPLAQKWAAAYSKDHPNVRFNIQAGGAGKGLTDCLAGIVDVGMFSRELTDAEKQKGIWWISLCKDAVIPTVNADNPYIDSIKTRGIKKDEFKSIFIDQRPATWDSLLNIKNGVKQRIAVYTRADAAGAADSWASFFGKKQENLKGIGVSGDPGVADAVKKDKGGIGYNNTLFVYDNETGKKNPGIEVVPIDVNGNGKIDAEENVYDNLSTFLDAVNTGKFPAPPARDLYFLTHGKSTNKAITDFFNWVLTDGQKMVKEAGYVPLPAATIAEQLKKLE